VGAIASAVVKMVKTIRFDFVIFVFSFDYRGYLPLPVSVMDCGLPGTASVNSILPLRFPDAAGVNVTVIEQVAPGASVAGELGHVFVSAKSPGSAPAIFTLLMLNGVPLGLPIVIT
jgi:hypothetical protein